jgi:hypothetical protein
MARAAAKARRGREVVTDAALDAARLRGDAPADELVAALGTAAWGISALMRSVRREDQPLPQGLPASARQFFLTEGLAPAWLDQARVLRAQRWAQDHLLHVTTALFCASLPTAYAAARGARVLAATGKLATDLDGRINETARFVLDILQPGALQPWGNGVRAIQKVRLIHASVRRSLPARTSLTDEVAINQEDLLGTMLNFSVIVVSAVQRLGIDVTPAVAEDFFHLWRAVGVMLGIERDLVPADFPQAACLAHQIGQRQFGASAHGQALMAALLARLEAHLPAQLMHSLPRRLVRHLVGDRLADLLAVPDQPRAGLFAGPSVQALLLRATPLLARPLLEGIVAIKLNAPVPAAR